MCCFSDVSGSVGIATFVTSQKKRTYKCEAHPSPRVETENTLNRAQLEVIARLVDDVLWLTLDELDELDETVGAGSAPKL